MLGPLAVVLLFGLWSVTGGDLCIWLTGGCYAWQQGGPPLVDVFSYPSAGESVGEASVRNPL